MYRESERKTKGMLRRNVVGQEERGMLLTQNVLLQDGANDL